MKNNLFINKKRTLLLTVLATINTFFFVAANNCSNAEMTIVSPQKSGISTIVFDLGDVLFTVPKSVHFTTIVPTILYNPTLLYWLTQINPKEAYFKFLDTLPATSTKPVYHKGQQLPLISADWLSGIKTPTEIKIMIEQALDKSDYATSVKNLFKAIASLMFIPENLAASQQIILPMVKLLEKFKVAGYKIDVLSNWDAYSFEILKQSYPNLFELCDEIIISGQENLSKPDPEFFKKLVDRAGLKPSESLFIDDEPYNIQAASALGFKTIQHIDAVTTSKELISSGIITLCQTI